MPNGFGPNNLPTGIQFIGPAWGEEVLFQVGQKYQQRTDDRPMAREPQVETELPVVLAVEEIWQEQRVVVACLERS